MKKCVYLYSPFSPRDFGIGPSKYARRDGIEALSGGGDEGHGMQMSLYRRIFTEIRQQVATELHSDTTSLHVRSIARQRVRTNHYEPDLRSLHTENSGAMEYESELEFSVLNGQVTYLNPDHTISNFTFSSFHERVKDDKNEETRKKYSPDAHKVDLLVESVILNAISPIEITKIAHDVKGFRDAYTFKYDPITNKGKIQINNMAPDGKALSIEEARKKMHSLFPDKQEMRPEQNIFILLNSESVSADRVFKTYSQAVEGKIPETSHGTHQAISDAVIITNNAFVHAKQEIADTATSVLRYIRSEKKENEDEKYSDAQQEKMDSILKTQKQEEISILLDNLLNESLGIENLDKLITEPSQVDTDGVNLTVLWQRKAQEELGISEQQAEQLEKQVETTHEEIIQARDHVLIAIDTEVGIGGALFLLDSMAIVDFHSLSDTTLKDRSLIISDILRTKDGKQTIDSSAILLIVDEFTEEAFEPLQEAHEIEVQPIGDAIVTGWVKEFISSLDQQTPEEAVIAIEEEQLSVIHTLESLWEMFEEFTGDQEQEGASFTAFDVREAQQYEGDTEVYKTPEVERQIVREFSFAVTVWMILKFAAYHQSLSSLKEVFIDIGQTLKNTDDKAVSIQKIGQIVKTRLSEALMVKEPTSWILLSIIWYLAMIREQGMYTSQTQQAQSGVIKPTKKKKKLFYQQSSFHSQGIIFAFGS